MQPRPRLARGRACVAADVVLTFGGQRIQHHFTLTTPQSLPLLTRWSSHLNSGNNWGVSMASNKKSSLTGYLPDILMAAAAVRSRAIYATKTVACLKTYSDMFNSH